MSYYIVNIETGKAWGKAYWLKQIYETERGAKTACTKMNKSFVNSAVVNGQNAEPKWKVMSRKDYDAQPVKMVEKINMMSGLPYMEAEDTPNFCSPSSEAYWSS